MSTFITELLRALLILAIVIVMLTLISIVPVQNSVIGKKIDLFFMSSSDIFQKIKIMTERFLTGNFGVTPGGNSVFYETVKAYSLSLELIIIAALVSVTTSVVLALYAAKYHDVFIVRFLNIVTFCFCNIPYFLTAIISIFIFSVMFDRWFGFSLPVTGMSDIQDRGFNLFSHLRHLVLPVSVISLIMFSQLYSFLRIQAESIYRKHFIKFSRALGIGDHVILFKYVLKNLLKDLTRGLINLFQTLIGIIIIIEIIFSWPGIGLKAYKSVLNLDIAGLFCILLLITTTVIVLQFITSLIDKSSG